MPWRNLDLIITILAWNKDFICIHTCCRWNIFFAWFNYWSCVNKGIASCICVISHCCFIICWNRWWVQNIEFSYSWTIVGNYFTNTFHVVVLTRTLKFRILGPYRVTKFTRHGWSVCLLVQNIPLKWTWVRSCIVLTLNTCLGIWSKFCFITSWFVALSCCICCWTVCIISWRCCINYFIVSCLAHLSWWNTNFNVWFAFSLVSWCQVVIHLFSRFGEWNISVVFNNDIHTCRTTISWCIIYKVWIISLRWKVSKIYFFTSVGWRQSCTCNFTSCILIYQAYINIRIVCASCLINWQCHIIVCVVILVIWFKIPNTKCHTICCWVSCVSRRNACRFVCKCCTISIVHTWSCVNTCCKCIWSSDWCQLSWNCWSTIYCCVSSKSCRSQGCHHVIYWLAQTFALVCVWLSWSIRIDQAVACCQFCLNFSDGSIKCCFLLWSWYSCWVVSCNLVQQCCFWSVLFQNNFIFSFRYCCSAFYTCFRASCYSWFAWSCWKFCWTLFAQWSWVRYRYACRGWSTCRCRSASWFCCWLSCWFCSWFCSWFRLRFSCWSCTKYSTSLLYKSFTWKLRCSRNVWSCFICFCSIRYCSCTKNSPSCYDPFEQATACHFFHWYCVFTHFSYNSLFDLTTNDLQKTKVRSRSTQPVFTWFDQFETSHTIRFTEFTVRTFKKHFCLLITFFISLTL